MSEGEAAVNGEAAATAEQAATTQQNKYSLVTDEFEGVVKFQDNSWKCDGAPNWRRLAGFPIYSTGQPLQTDLEKCVEQAVNKFDEQKAVLWVNLRQEPVIYINGKPYSVRESGSIQKHIVMTEAFEINNLENEIASGLKKGDGTFSFFKDAAGEQEREKDPEAPEQKSKVEKISTLSEIFSNAAKKEPKLESARIPFNLNAAPYEDTVDMIIRLLKGQSSAVPVIFNCQGGITRSTTAAVIAAVIKEAQLEIEFSKMRGVIPDSIIDGLRATKLHPPLPEHTDKQNNALLRGDFPVVLDLLESCPVARECKEQVDRIINAAGAAENIRESPIMEKMQFDVAADDWRLVLKERIMDQIERYFMLIVFTIYTKEVGPTGFNQTFKKWLDSTNYRELIAEGKSKLEWERKIPEEKIQDLKDMMNQEDFDAIMPQVINKINQLSYKMFNDLPRGDQKCKSMRKLAGRTLLEVLPPKLTVYLEFKLGNLSNVPDFYDMVGTLSMYGKCPVGE